MESRHLSRVIKASPESVYEFASDLDKLPLWAAGLAEAEVERHAGTVVVDSPMGRVEVQFVARNEYGVLDHDVTLPSGEVVHNPLRVLAHPDGAEVVFTVRQLDLSDEEFERDCQMVADDLTRLKEIVEGPAARRG
ncbi:SRPBCC family protein [Tessaracoccus sp. ZS01]|uniref:SRPBCC family protein n=1 Tax=Tessaracoccus sp. ZS01 TaxID=1906324 RepID=UPI00096FF9E7|nr:SRPBCC family protein [Tessaracoccus sp. ZS01]MCG6568377.1 SRPBCC family protein [Tessaracoccus sp. ZS01]OMG52783.1 polyketide cyclase [Tessaracoccus sp. ZS01]